MWMCTTEIANRNKPLGEAAEWGRVLRSTGPSSSKVLLKSPLLSSQDTPLSHGVYHACRWVGPEPLGM